MQYETIGYIAGMLALGGYIPYIIAILRGQTKPNRATWLIWTIVGGLLAVSYIAAGENSKSIWLPIGYFVGPFFTALLSIRYGYSAWSKLDSICVLLALLSLIPWLLTHNPITTLAINVFIDLLGAVPTLVKTYREPETEDLTAWFIFFVANTLQLFAIETWNLTALYPLYLFFLAGSLTILILKDKIRLLTSN